MHTFTLTAPKSDSAPDSIFASICAIGWADRLLMVPAAYRRYRSEIRSIVVQPPEKSHEEQMFDLMNKISLNNDLNDDQTLDIS